VGGAGPGGLASAIFLRRVGADVTVVDPQAINSLLKSNLVVGSESWDAMRALGVGHLLDDTTNRATEFGHIVSREALVSSLYDVAEREGVQFRPASVEDVLRGANVGDTEVSIAISDARTGADSAIDGQWYIDATGGRAPMLDRLGLGRARFEKENSYSPTEVHYIAAHAKYQPHSGLSLGNGSAFAISNPREGYTSVYLTGDRELRAADLKTRTALIDQAFTELGIPVADRNSEPYAFSAIQKLASDAARGRVLVTGDGIGSQMPSTLSGTSLAILDGVEAARAIVNAHHDPAHAADIVRAYSGERVLMHQMSMV
jgi:2-polyprenyl-6-methoxyphenol hydroxylase-like FAD-dependent oxidoreductase